MSSPALNEKTWDKVRDYATEDVMTIEGTINKSGLLILLTISGAYFGWNTGSMGALLGSFLATLIMSIIIIFKPKTASYLSQVYALMEGFLLGSISSTYAFKYPGVVTNALFGTIGCFTLMLVLYRTGIIRVTEKFRMVLIAATGAIALTYLINFAMGFFGTGIPMIHESTPMGIAFSVIVVGVAAFNLMLDFSMIEEAHARRAPKFMEWYCGFALLLTLVWLYIEMLRLMSKLNKK